MKSKNPSTTTFIGIEDLVVRCFIGINPHELAARQEIIITIRAEVCIEKSFASDAIHDTLDYRFFAEVCETLVARQHYNLIEKFASDVADVILAQPSIHAVTILIRKPKALGGLACPFVELTRKREGD